MPSFNMISSCGKGGKAPGGSVSNVGGKNQISLDVSYVSFSSLAASYAHFKPAG